MSTRYARPRSRWPKTRELSWAGCYRTQPAVLLAQFARAADAEGIGGELLEHAVGATRRALWWIGATVLVVDPFDEATDGYWREHWGLRPSEQRVPGNRRLRRLWTAIPR